MKKIYTFLTLLLAFSISNAQVDMEISNGITVETTGGVSIELSGNLIETGTGYLKGVVTTGDRGANTVSSFAGLNLNASVDQITRTTGSAYSAASPRTSLRSYKLENTTASTSNVTSTYIESGTNIETNAVGTPFLYTNVGSNWTGYDDNSTTTNSVGASSVLIPAGTSNLAISEGVGVGARIFLEGPYTSPNTMSTAVFTSIPSASPYTLAPRSTVKPAGAVDWVMLELRTGTGTGTVVSRRSAFVNADGYIIDDGNNVGTGMAAAAGNYYLVVKHRNHLGVMSNGTVSGFNWVSN